MKAGARVNDIVESYVRKDEKERERSGCCCLLLLLFFFLLLLLSFSFFFSVEVELMSFRKCEIVEKGRRIGGCEMAHTEERCE